MLDRAQMNRAFDQAEASFGTVTVLVNNAGVAHSTRAIEVSEDEWNHVVRTNLDAVFFWAQEGARRMLKAGAKGSIVNIASVLGFGVSKGTIAYATAKAGVIQMTKALGNELKDLDFWPDPDEQPEFYTDFGETGPYVADVGVGECAAG